MIPKNHPRYKSLVTREHLAENARSGIVSWEGLISHGRGEAFDYLIGEKTSESARRAARTAAALLRTARHPVISVNGNTAVLAAQKIALLQKVSGALVEVNLFHRTSERVQQIETLLRNAGVDVFSGNAERLLPLSHDRAFCQREGMYAADVVLVPLEDGDRCGVLVAMGKKVIAIDLNPLSRTAKTATLTIVDDVTRALPLIAEACASITGEECRDLIATLDNPAFLREARDEMAARLCHALD
ncbi:MAG: 4-phosphopantoate--beta-alanine ligase [Methanoregula sp.]|uniref:4-phosphopantoate--beta-alanine ligase n=1 Tax=Methanoregula sp. TaxID=2052170 RepID=UPI003BAED0D2